MRIKSIGARNFRTLEDLTIEFRADYCTLSGKNNAGKTAIVSIIEHFLEDIDRHYLRDAEAISFSRDRTQWSGEDHMSLSIVLEIDRSADTELYFFLEKFSPSPLESDRPVVTISQDWQSSGETKIRCSVDGLDLDGQTSVEILKKFRSAENLAIHNSTQPHRRVYYSGEGRVEVFEAYLQPDDRKKIAQAEATLQTRVRQATKQHKEELQKLLGKLSDQYQVELSSLESGRSRNFPLAVSLTDKSVEVPLLSWGAGTQNRTRTLMSILEAVRMRSSEGASDRVTPVVIVEEPESFLHPSAQAEFGQVLRQLAEELEIQIIATTHSPYMLNQSVPHGNILLNRKHVRGKLKSSEIVNTGGDNWMLPFAEILGVIPDEFTAWKPIFGAKKDRVILVEGEIDRSYFYYIRENFPDVYQVAGDIDVVPYGGKDALKNTQLLKFVIDKFERVFVTFDKDVEKEVEPALARVGLEEGRDYCAVGKANAGDDCIEGLVPSHVKSAVYAREHMLVTAIASNDAAARKSARSTLKSKIFEEFSSSLSESSNLKEFRQLFRSISRAFSK